MKLAIIAIIAFGQSGDTLIRLNGVHDISFDLPHISARTRQPCFGFGVLGIISQGSQKFLACRSILALVVEFEPLFVVLVGQFEHLGFKGCNFLLGQLVVGIDGQHQFVLLQRLYQVPLFFELLCFGRIVFGKGLRRFATHHRAAGQQDQQKEYADNACFGFHGFLTLT